jgi:hypothetical protein
MSMFRVQAQVAATQWVDLSRTPTGVFAQGLAEVRRTVAAEAPVRVIQDPIKRGQLINVVV